METVVLESFLLNWLAMAVEDLIMAYVMAQPAAEKLQFI